VALAPSVQRYRVVVSLSRLRITAPLAFLLLLGGQASADHPSLRARLCDAGQRLTAKVRRIGKERAAVKNVAYFGSTVGLGAVELWQETAGKVTGAAHLAHVGARGLGMVSAVTQLGVGAHDLILARNHTERLDAGSGMAWGAQGMLALSGVRLLQGAAPLVGVVGAACQLGAGRKRVIRGWREHDRRTVRLGLLDMANGAAWLAWDVVGLSNPYFLGATVGLMAAREAYENHDAVKAFGKRVGAKLAHGASVLRERTASSLRSLAAGLR
jgi:hypothetical protein